MEISNHCFERAKERYSLNKESFQRLVGKALIEGRGQNDLKGNLKKYIGNLAKQYKAKTIIYGEFILFFGGDVLITTYQVPNNLKKYLKL